MWLLGLWLAALCQAAAWTQVEDKPSLSLADWETVTRFHAFVDEKSGRILLERKGQPPLILLLAAPYALVADKFVALPEPPRRRGNEIFLAAESAERVFRLPKSERATFAALLASATVKAQVPAEPAAAALPKKLPTVATLPAPCELQRPVKRVFLDPGHGGYDVGTKAGASLEKNITLQFARLAADELRRRGFEVTFSRTKDVFLPLDIRTKLAAEWKADLFLSLHVNSSPQSSAHGTETYILSQDATDAEARKLALIENSIATSAGREKQSAVQDILWDMEQTAYLQESAYLASYIQEALVANAHELLQKRKEADDWKNRGVRQAPFYVLNRAAMPAILVELGYLSNASDRKRLLNRPFLESLARALAEGVKKYKEACRKGS